jgi:hypothetical protein
LQKWHILKNIFMLFCQLLSQILGKSLFSLIFIALMSYKPAILFYMAAATDRASLIKPNSRSFVLSSSSRHNTSISRVHSSIIYKPLPAASISDSIDSIHPSSAYTLDYAAERLSCCQRTVRRLVEKGELMSVSLSETTRGLRINGQSLIDFIQRGGVRRETNAVPISVQLERNKQLADRAASNRWG